MTITTKFNINDEVWYYNHEPISVLVVKILIEVDEVEADVRYLIKISDGHTGYWHETELEKNLFPSKQALLDSLR